MSCQCAIPDFIAKVVQGDFEGAYETITGENALPAICRVSAHRRTSVKANACVPLKKQLVLDVLERFVATIIVNMVKISPLKLRKMARKLLLSVLDPTGISCLGELAKRGYEVTVFEALHKTGRPVLRYSLNSVCRS